MSHLETNLSADQICHSECTYWITLMILAWKNSQGDNS